VSDILLTIGAVLLLIFGAVYPLVAIFALVNRMNRPGLPPPSPINVMLRLFLIATVPIAGILGGFAGLVPAVWESFFLRVLILATGAASLAGFVILAVVAQTERNQRLTPPSSTPPSPTPPAADKPAEKPEPIDHAGGSA
jgi:hypothetical protein